MQRAENRRIDKFAIRCPVVDSFDLLPSLADGELAESSAPELVAAIFRSRASGTLTIEAPESGEVRQFFRAGQMCGSAYFTGFRTLAQVMLEQEWGQAIAIDETLAEAQSQGRRHGELLVEKGLLTAEQLAQVLSAQHRHNLMALMRLDRGHYEMRGWEPPPAWTRELNIDPLGPLFDTLEEPRLLHRRALVLDWIGGQAVRLTPDWPEMAQRAQLDAADLRAIGQLAVPRGRSEFLAVSRLATPRADALLAGLVLIGAAEPVASAAPGARPLASPAPSLYGSSLPPPPLSSPSRPISQPPRPPQSPLSQPPRPAAQPQVPISKPSPPFSQPPRPISQPPRPQPPPLRPFSQPPRHSEPSLPAARIPTPPQPTPQVSPRPPSRPSMPAVRSGARTSEPPRPAPPPVEEELDLVGPMARTAMPMSEPLGLQEAMAGEEPLELDESALPEAVLASNPGVEKGALEIEEEPEGEEGPLELDSISDPRSRPTPHARAPRPPRRGRSRCATAIPSRCPGC